MSDDNPNTPAVAPNLDMIAEVTGFPTVFVDTCPVCRHNLRPEIDWLIMCHDLTYREVAEVYGLQTISITAHGRHTKLSQWRLGKEGIRLLMSDLISNGSKNFHKAKPSDVIRAVEVMAKIDGLIKPENQAASLADYVQAIRSASGGAQRVVIDDADIQDAEYTDSQNNSTDSSDPQPY